MDRPGSHFHCRLDGDAWSHRYADVDDVSKPRGDHHVGGDVVEPDNLRVVAGKENGD